MIKIIAVLLTALTVSIMFVSCPGGAEEYSPPEGSQGEIDCGNLSLESALNRLYEVDRDIQIVKLSSDAAVLGIKARKMDIFLPKISVAGSVVKPFDLFSDLDQQTDLFSEQQLVIEMSITSDSLNYISKDRKSYEASLLDIKQVITWKTRKLISVYYAVAAAQENYRMSRDNVETVEKVIDIIKDSPEYTETEKLELKNYLGIVNERKIGALNTLINTRRDLRGLLGLEDNDDLDIVVQELPGNVNRDPVFAEKAEIRPKSYTLDIVKKRSEEASVAAHIGNNPRLKLTSTTILGLAEGKGTRFERKVITDTQLELFVTDFGHSEGLNRTKSLESQIARLEVLKASEDLECEDLKGNAKITDLRDKIDNYREYIAKTEDTLRMLREKLSLPVIEIIRMNDNLYKAKYALQQALSDYTVTLSNLNGIELKPENTSPAYQDMGLEDLISRGERADFLTARQIAEKRIKIEKVRIGAEKAGYLPKLYGAAVLENVNINGTPSKNTRAFLALEGRILDNKVGAAVKAARAGLKEAECGGRALQSVVADEVIRNYLLVLRFGNTLKKLDEIKRLKDDLISDMLEDMKGKNPKYTNSDILPLVLQRLEVDKEISNVEFSLAVAEYNLKKWTGIPLNETITVKELALFGSEEGLSDFKMMLKEKVAPYYDGMASVKQALNTVERKRAGEAKALAYEGAIWQVRYETKGSDYDGWEDPDKQLSFSVSIPWGDHAEKIAMSEAARDRIRSEIEYAKSMDSYEKERFAVKSAYDASNDLLNDLRNKMENSGNQFKITDELYKFGGRTKRQWADARLDYLVSQLTYEESAFDNYYASAREILFVEKDARQEGSDKILLSGLQEALDIALCNSREVKKYEEALSLEEESLNYYKMIRVNGNVSKGYYVMDNRGSQKKKTVQTTGAVVSAEVDLVNKLMVKKQELRVELARKDLEQAKFDLSVKVVDAYCDYLASLAEYSQVNDECEKQKAVLAGVEELYAAGAVAHVDYYKQKEFVESLLQKVIDIKKHCDGYRSNLGIVVGGLDPRFSIMNVEVYDGSSKKVTLADNCDIKERLTVELGQAKKDLDIPLREDLLKRAEFNIEMARLDTEAISKQIKSLAFNLEYTYLTDFMGAVTRNEAIFSRYDSLSEFISLNSMDKIFDPATGTKARIAALKEKITALKSKSYMSEVLQNALRIFTDYKMAVLDYENFEKNVTVLEERMGELMRAEEATGDTPVVRQREIKETLLNNKINNIQAYYRMVSLMNELDRYLMRYTAKGIDSYITYVSK